MHKRAVTIATAPTVAHHGFRPASGYVRAMSPPCWQSRYAMPFAPPAIHGSRRAQRLTWHVTSLVIDDPRCWPLTLNGL
jgi:hypothetical protein